MIEQVEPFFLFIGHSDSEGATSKLKATGIQYKKKLLESSLPNWEKIFKYLESKNIAGALVKLSRLSYNLMARDSYREASIKLFSTLYKVPHIVFVHESYFTGVSDKAPDEDADEEDYLLYRFYFEPPSQAVREYVNVLMEQHEINVVPYRKNAELSVMASSFIDQNEKNLIFRMYIPIGRMWSIEAEKFLQLFRDYLSRVSGLKVRQDEYRTNKGMVYEFFGDHTLDPSILPKEFDDFSKLLDLCIASPDDATTMLLNKNIKVNSVHDIVERYAKEAKRLHIDLKQERERMVLSIRHRMESELVDVMGIEGDWQAINQIVDISIPILYGISSAIGFNAPDSYRLQMTNTTININPQIIRSVQGIVAQEISGNQNFGIEANQLISLINLYAGTRSAELTSAVYELEDEDVKPIDRISAKQKLKGFLFKVAEKTGDVAFHLLQTYIEGKMGL